MKKAKGSDKIAVNQTQSNQETFAMKTITEILEGAQALLDINYNLQNCFEERLTDGHKSFLHTLRAVEQFLPAYTRLVAQTGRPPYQHYSFVRSMLAKSFSA